MSYTIDTSVVAPARTFAVNKYPLRQLKPARIVGNSLMGPSFLIPGKRTADVGSSVYQAAKMAGVSVTLRQMPDGVRVYRLETERKRA